MRANPSGCFTWCIMQESDGTQEIFRSGAQTGANAGEEALPCQRGSPVVRRVRNLRLPFATRRRLATSLSHLISLIQQDEMAAIEASPSQRANRLSRSLPRTARPQ